MELRYPAELPIVERREEIVAAIRAHQVIVVSGETGSGKTTQLPKMCLEAGRGTAGRIGHTQPRRLAARAVAERIAEELGTSLGDEVGYAVRFTDRVSDSTVVKLMTDGILLAELHRDRDLRAYDTIIIDEAHERSLTIDFLLGYIQGLLPRRPDLKLLITSATIDTARFATHFGEAPVIEVSGRSYPVETRYRPIEDDDVDQVQAIADAIDELPPRGDVLVFLSGERDIRDAAEHLNRTVDRPDVEVLPLYGRLTAAEQHRVFAAHTGRRIVLATNVAETSLTVPGIRYVVDPGNARVSRFNRRTKVQRLPIEPISQASANQRAGRCGRVAAGICIRLYSEEDFQARPEFTDPEILRTNLASVILQMAALELGDVASFPFLDPPDSRAIRDGVELLEEVGALDGSRLTRIGRQLSRIPVDPRYGRMLIEADREGCLREMLVIVAGLSIQDPRERPTDRLLEAAESHARFLEPTSDFLSMLRLWEHIQGLQRELSGNQFRRRCRSEFLNFLRVREWQDLHGQLGRSVRELRFSLNDRPADPDRIHRAAVAGLLSHIGMHDPEKPEYRGARDSRFAIARGSALAGRAPRWVMAAELVETNRTWARMAAPIDPAWAERIGAHVVKRTYGDPMWDRSRATAVAPERVSLYGLPLVGSRRVEYGRVDAEAAREMFIHHALVEDDWDAPPPFVASNRARIEAISDLEVRARRPLYLGDDALADFYDRRIGPEVTSGRSFARWHRDQSLEASFLDLVDPSVEIGGLSDFPDHLLGYDLTYVFDPGADDDGINVDIPLVRLNTLQSSRFEWLVPGLRSELVAALVRTLPKPARREIGPPPDVATAFLEKIGPDDGPLIPSLAAFVSVAPSSFQPSSLPPHLRMTYRIVDRHKTVAVGTDLDALRLAWGEASRDAIRRATGWVEQHGQKSWTFGPIPPVVEGHGVRGFPSLVDEGESVGTAVWTTEDEQRREMWAGTSRLLSLVIPVAVKDLERRLSNAARLAIGRGGYTTVSALIDDCVTAAIDAGLNRQGGPVWDAEPFADLARAIRPGLRDVATAVVTFAGGILAAVDVIDRRLARLTAISMAEAVADIRSQVDALVFPRFVQVTGSARLPDVLRYLRAVDRRLDKLPEDPGRDAVRMRRVQALQDELAAAPAPPGRKVAVRWMIEELRVGEFAQVLGTAHPVSDKRIRTAIAAL